MEGVAEGSDIGSAVKSVGLADVMAVGSAVGVAVEGLGVRTGVGFVVGAEVRADGTEVGLLEGNDVGLTEPDGFRVGLGVGETDG